MGVIVESYAGKKAVVIGGTHGMGLAVVKKLLKGGAEVLLTGNNEKNVETAKRELASEAAHVVRSDVRSLAQIEQLAATVADKFGTIDFVHYNAGLAALEPFELVTEESYDLAFDINAKGAFFTVQKLAPIINEGGGVVFTSSVADVGGTSALVTYSGAKAAVMALARGIAGALIPRKIRVNVVCPGFIDTPTMGIIGLSDEERAAFMETGDQITPIKRHGSVDEVADAVLFLGFDATYTTGERLTVDGGISQSIEVPA